MFPPRLLAIRTEERLIKVAQRRFKFSERHYRRRIAAVRVITCFLLHTIRFLMDHRDAVSVRYLIGSDFGAMGAPCR